MNVIEREEDEEDAEEEREQKRRREGFATERIASRRTVFFFQVQVVDYPES